MAKVLVVDDAAFMRLRTAKVLTEAGHTVVEAENGRRAVDLYAVERPDVVLMDITMPEMDGLQVTEIIRAQEPQERALPIIALTAHAMPSDQERCFAAGMNGYLSKPIKSEELFAAIARVLGNTSNPLSHTGQARTNSPCPVLPAIKAKATLPA